MSTPSSDDGFQTYYRSIRNGVLWGESRDAQEVINRSDGFDVTFEVMHVRLVSNGWEPWLP